ncbi:MAG: N-acetylneuraminate synthase family protein [Ignavibacteriae bacterium]|nr:N-acetylneuraminate synthase family protein [Ignavibacteriota bacterium]
MRKTIKIAGRTIGENNPTFLIAEIGQAHDGSLGIAHSYIDAVAKTGFDAIKFQTHIAEAESTFDEEFRVKFSFEDKTRFDYWKRMEFSAEQWLELKKHADEKNLIFMSSAFSIEAVQLLNKIGIELFKIGSGDFNSEFLLKEIIKTNKPLLLSCGMHSIEEIKERISWLKNYNVKAFGLFQCTSKYPTPLPEVGINVIDQLKENCDFPIGLSDHSGTIYPSLLALAKQTDLIEVHATFSKDSFGPDSITSLTMDELKFIAEAREKFNLIINNPVDKTKNSGSFIEMKKLFSRSIALKHDLNKGEVITKEMLTFKKPASGIPESQTASIIGKKAVNNISRFRLLKWNDLE